MVADVVHRALASRDLADPESITEAKIALLDGIERLLDRSLGPYEARRFR